MEVVNLASLDGSNGFVIRGIDEGDSLGTSVSNAGDVNGDGIDDIIIGAPFAETNRRNRDRGESYVIFGSSEGFTAEFDLNNLDGSNGFIIRGLDEDDRLGDAVSNAGDVNGDGFDDIIIGAFGANYYYTETGNAGRKGESYVVFGSNEGFTAELDLNNLDGSNGFALRPIESNYTGSLVLYSGDSVSSAGDINGDGFDDIIIGAPAILIMRMIITILRI